MRLGMLTNHAPYALLDFDAEIVGVAHQTCSEFILVVTKPLYGLAQLPGLLVCNHRIEQGFYRRCVWHWFFFQQINKVSLVWPRVVGFPRISMNNDLSGKATNQELTIPTSKTL